MGELIKKLVEFFQNPLTGKMYFVSKAQDGFSVFSKNMEVPVVIDFRTNYMTYLEKRVDFDEEDYNASEQIDTNTVYLFDGDNLSQLKGLLKTKESRKSANFEKKIDFTFIEFNSENEELHVFKISRPSKFLKKSKRKLLFLKEDVLTFSNTDAMVVDDSIDCILFKGKIIILNVSNFESIYDLKRYYLPYSTEVFTHLSTKTDYIIVDLPKLQKKCEHSLKSLKRMYVIKNLGVYSNLTLEKINKYNDRRNLGLRIDGSNIKFPSTQEFYKLYNDDDEFTSPLTNFRYQSLSKRRVN